MTSSSIPSTQSSDANEFYRIGRAIQNRSGLSKTTFATEDRVSVSTLAQGWLLLLLHGGSWLHMNSFLMQPRLVWHHPSTCFGQGTSSSATPELERGAVQMGVQQKWKVWLASRPVGSISGQRYTLSDLEIILVSQFLDKCECDTHHSLIHL